jgi:lipopolysaccharide transport system permease protein
MFNHPVLQYVLVMSPMYAAVELFRFPLTNIEINYIFLTISLSASLFFLVVGVFYFKKMEDFFADFA